MKTARPLPAEFQDRPFTVAEANRAGVTPKRLRHRSLRALGKGIRAESPTAELALRVRVRPFIEVNERCAASHLTAAELLKLPRRRQKGASEMYSIIRPEGAAHLTRPHVIVHRMKLYDDEVTILDGVPVTTPERTWLDLAELLTVDELVVAGDSCVRVPRPQFDERDKPLCTLVKNCRLSGISRDPNDTQRWAGPKCAFPSATCLMMPGQPSPMSAARWSKPAGGPTVSPCRKQRLLRNCPSDVSKGQLRSNGWMGGGWD
jgi:hypothetical protein